MATRPDDYLGWTDGNATKVSKPPTALAAAGWSPGQAPTAQHMNFALWRLDQWTQYLDQRSSGGGGVGSVASNTRLLGGGTWSLAGTTLSWSAAFNISLPGLADSANQVAAGGVTIPDGSCAYVNLNVPITYGAATTQNSTSMTNLTGISGLVAGMSVSGPGIATGTTITSVSGTTVVLSQNATSTNGSAIYTFTSSGSLTASVAAESSMSPGPQTCIFARNSGGVVLVGVSAVDMQMRDGESRPLRGGGFGRVITAVAGQSMTQGTVVYVADSTDTGRSAGSCYPTDATANGTQIRAVAAGILAQNVANGATATIVTDGVVGGFTGLNAGCEVWASVYVAGSVQQWVPPFIATSFKVLVGFAVSSTQVMARGGGADQSMSPNPLFNNLAAVNINATGLVSASDLQSVSAEISGAVVTGSPTSKLQMQGKNTNNRGMYLTPDFLPYAMGAIAANGAISNFVAQPNAGISGISWSNGTNGSGQNSCQITFFNSLPTNAVVMALPSIGNYCWCTGSNIAGAGNKILTIQFQQNAYNTTNNNQGIYIPFSFMIFAGSN